MVAGNFQDRMGTVPLNAHSEKISMAKNRIKQPAQF
jgi:hypothetical protein